MNININSSLYVCSILPKVFSNNSPWIWPQGGKSLPLIPRFAKNAEFSVLPNVGMGPIINRVLRLTAFCFAGYEYIDINGVDTIGSTCNAEPLGTKPRVRSLPRLPISSEIYTYSDGYLKPHGSVDQPQTLSSTEKGNASPIWRYGTNSPLY